MKLSDVRPSRVCAPCSQEVTGVRQRANSISEAAEQGIPFTITIHGHPFKGLYLGAISDIGEPHGQGCLKGEDGSWYTGDWENGHFTGQGKLIINDGETMKYDGGWYKATFQGTGILYHPNCTSIRYEGEWANDLRHGQGTSYDADGKIEQRGRWEQGNFMQPSDELEATDL